MQKFSSYSLSELKSYCTSNGIHVTGDKRRKQSFIDSIKQHNRHNQISDNASESTLIVETAPTTAPISYFVDKEEHLPVKSVDYFINLEESTKEAPASINSVAIPALVLLLPILCLLLTLEIALRAIKQAIPAVRRTVAAIPRLSLPSIPSRVRWQT